MSPRHRFRLRLGAAAAILGSPVLAQAPPLAAQPGAFDEPWRWVRFTTASGLPSDNVLDVLETADGTVWAATSLGLAWYDGYRWIPVVESDGLPSVAPRAVAAGADGSVLVIADFRLYQGDTSGFRWIPVEVAGVPQEVGAAALLPGGAVLIHAGGILYRHESGRLEPDTTYPGFPDDPARSLRVGRRGDAWLSVRSGLYRWEQGRWVHKAGLLMYGACVVAESVGRGLLYVWDPVESRGLWEWGGGRPLGRHSTEGQDIVVGLDVAPSGRAVVAYGSGDVKVREAGAGASFRPINAPERSVHAVHFGGNGDLWLATGRGLLVYRESSGLWTHWRHEAPDLRNTVHEILRTGDGAVWLATLAGVEILRPDGTSPSVRRIDGVPLGIVTGLAEDDEGGVWISSGASFAGAYRWDGQRWRHFGEREGLTAARVHKIRKDRHGRLWFLGMAVGADSPTAGPGAYVYADGRFERWGEPEGLPSGRVYAFGQASDGTLWFGTAGGLSRWRDGRWTHWTVEDGLRRKRIFTLAVGHDDRVWFGDQASGLGYIDARDELRYLRETDGLVADGVWDLRVDRDGTLWIAGSGGLGSYRDGVWSRIGVDVGLSNLNLWPVLPVGDRVYVGTQGSGVSVLNLQEARRASPRVVVRDPVVEGNSVHNHWAAYAYGGQLAPEAIETRYRIDDGPWSAWSTRREVALSDVRRGSHTLEVEAKGLLGGMSPSARADFAVEPPMYLRPSYLAPLAALALALALSGGALVQRRRRHTADLAASEARYRRFVEGSPDILYAVSDKRGGVCFSARVESVLGYPRSAFYANPSRLWHDAIHPEDVARVDDAVRRSVEGEAFEMEYRIRDATGAWRWLHDRSIGVRHEGGERIIEGLASDITERKRAEALMHAQRDLSVALAAAPGLAETLRRCLEAAIRVSGMDCGGIYLVDEISGGLDLASHAGLSPEFISHASHYSADSPNARAVAAGKPLYGRFQDLAQSRHEGLHREGLRALAVVGVLHEGRAIACLNVASHTADEIPRFAREALEAVAPQIGSAVARSQAERALQQSRERLRNLAARLHTVREEERVAIARELHDELGQALTALQIDLTWLAEKMPEGNDDLRARVDAMVESVDSTVDTVRRIAAYLRPPILDDMGLEAAIAWQVEGFAERTGIPCDVATDLGGARPDRTRATAIFRILQEALTNVARHAGARHVLVRLDRDGENAVLRVEDDGKGIGAGALQATTSLGLIGMRERAGALGGRATIGRAAAGGTEVVLSMPLASSGSAS